MPESQLRSFFLTPTELGRCFSLFFNSLRNLIGAVKPCRATPCAAVGMFPKNLASGNTSVVKSAQPQLRKELPGQFSPRTLMKRKDNVFSLRKGLLFQELNTDGRMAAEDRQVGAQ